jgi:hypothetical protein
MYIGYLQCSRLEITSKLSQYHIIIIMCIICKKKKNCDLDVFPYAYTYNRKKKHERLRHDGVGAVSSSASGRHNSIRRVIRVCTSLLYTIWDNNIIASTRCIIIHVCYIYILYTIIAVLAARRVTDNGVYLCARACEIAHDKLYLYIYIYYI